MSRKRHDDALLLLDSGDREDDDPETGPERRCIATGQRGPKDGLIRFAVGPSGDVVPDLSERLPGRGLWVAARWAALQTAVAKRAFSRAARRSVTVPEDLPARVEAGLVTRLVEGLGFARRAGSAVSGFEKVAAALSGGRVALLLEAQDGAENGRRKLLAGAGEVSVLTVLSAAELGRAFGREHVVHVAVTGRNDGGGMVARLQRDAGRLAGLRESGRRDGMTG